MKSKIMKFALFLVCIMISIACASHFSNIVKGTVQGVFWGVLLYSIFLVIFFVLERFIKSIFKRTLLYLAGIIPYAAIIALWHWFYLAPPSAILFERVLYSPPPQSITELVSVVEYPGKDIHFRIRFTIDSADLDLVLKRFSSTRRSPFRSYDDYPGRIYDSLDAFYLKHCETYSWWNNDKLLHLPSYTWDDDRYWRNLWFDDTASGSRYTVYISGIGG